MKKGFTRTEVLPDSLKGVQDDATTKAGLAAYYGLLCLLADIADCAARGDNVWCTLGLSRDRSAILLTVINNGAKLYASGADLREISAAAQELLD